MAGGGGEENPVGINVTAMVDIIFCLCLFFMCSLKFRELDGKMDSWLPKNKGNNPAPDINIPVDEIRILLSWNKEAQAMERLFGMRSIPPGAAGDDLLRQLIKEQNQSFRSLGKNDVPVIIDAGPAVPWEEVVKVMNMSKEVNIAKIEFAFGSVMKENG